MQGTNKQQTKFQPWLQEVSPKWRWDWPFQELLYTYLNRMTAGELNQLMIFMPPRHTKSETVTVRYPIYRLEKNPELRVIVGAYNTDLATKFSRKARKLANGRITFSDDRRQVEDWETEAGGGYRAVGVGSGVTGHGGELILIDDPVKSRKEAESETYREAVWDWYTNDLFTRLEPGGQMVLIMTRWHEDDLAGRILASEDGPNWTVLSLPAIAEDGDPLGREIGEPLCPDRFDEKALGKIRTVLGSYAWNALYQQRPMPPEGARFKRDWFRYFSVEDRSADGVSVAWVTMPDGREYRREECWFFQTIDAAATEKEDSDYSVILTWAVTPRNELLLWASHREKAETTKHLDMVMAEFGRHRPAFIAVEEATYGLAIIQRLQVLSMPVIPMKADKDKLSRSLPVQAMYEAGVVYHRAGMADIDTIEREILSFPVGKHDDIVDCISYAGVYMTQYAPWQEPPVEKDPEDTRKKGSITERFETVGTYETEEYY